MSQLKISAVSQEVEKAASADGTNGQLASAFTAALFSMPGEAQQDLFPKEKLTQLAISAFSFFQKRAPEERKLRVYDYDDGGAGGPITVIEAVNDDMPFLLSSVLVELNDRGFSARYVAHPIFRVHRDADGELTGLVAAHSAPTNAGHAESFFHIHIDPLESDRERAGLLEGLETIFEQVRIVVSDWMPMVSRLREDIDTYENLPPPVAVDELAESIQFMKWHAEGHLTILGVREYVFSMDGAEPQLDMKPETGLGLLRSPDMHVLRRTGSHQEMSPIAQEFFAAPDLLIIAKANFLSPVQRRVHTDSIGIKLYSSEGELTGELRFVGLFSASAYNESSRRIPLLKCNDGKACRIKP
jgi:glutamate dehydrogenase